MKQDTGSVIVEFLVLCEREPGIVELNCITMLQTLLQSIGMKSCITNESNPCYCIVYVRQ